ncbi:glycosyltransferase family 2 protein [Paenibacillus amylolyticus]|nr:glycosyltransferase family 2 protein [Paenibacillus amylolyticus]WFR63761.1 glycosyltransferase family 2 protein [Paenibacillus amylolyticus]
MITTEQKDGPIILIPSLEPDERLLFYVRQLRDYGFIHIVIVDDGSGEAYQHIFEELGENGCALLRHADNQGKGAALKTGFRYIAQQYGAASFVVTADSDGQHAAEDVYRIAQEARLHPDSLVLGVRNFSEGDIPPKSLFGNRMTSFIFAMLYGRKLSDTQTGLRAFGPGLLAFMQDVRGIRFEYELQMLISCIQSGIPIHTMPIQVIYENGNAGTHFKAIQDSARVMGCCSPISCVSYHRQWRVLLLIWALPGF